jgi:hypothetical protein
VVVELVFSSATIATPGIVSFVLLSVTVPFIFYSWAKSLPETRIIEMRMTCKTCIFFIIGLGGYKNKNALKYSSRADDSKYRYTSTLASAGKSNTINILLPSRLYCRYRRLTGSILLRGVADCTADREFHPALKKAMHI